RRGPDTSASPDHDRGRWRIRLRARARAGNVGRSKLMSIARRDLFRIGAAGGGFGLIGGLAYSAPKWFAARQTAPTPPTSLPIDCGTDVQSSAAYAARFQPAPYLTPGSRDVLHLPPPQRGASSGTLLEIDLPIIETTLEVANGRNVRVWAYGGTVPGPIIRA